MTTVSLENMMYEAVKEYIGKCGQEYVSFFNPCIVSYADKVIISVRIVSNHPKIKECEKVYDALTPNLNWDNIIDSTIFFRTDLNFSELSLLFVNRKGDILFENMVDTRIFLTEDGKLYLTYNRYQGSDNQFLGLNCKKYSNLPYCAVMYISEIIPNNDVLFIRDMNPLCLDLMSLKESPVEKNWCFANLNRNDVLTFNYWLFSNENTLVLEHNLKTKECKEIPVKNSLDSNSLQFFNESMSNKIHLSLGSPSVILNQNECLSVGHAKINEQIATENGIWYNLPVTTSNGNAWTSHPNPKRNFIYVMFLCITDRNTGSLKKVSRFFINVTDTDTRKVYFPTGLVITKTDFYISYGQSDKFSKILRFKKDIYDTLFMPGNFKELIVLKDGKLVTSQGFGGQTRHQWISNRPKLTDKMRKRKGQEFGKTLNKSEQKALAHLERATELLNLSNAH